MRDNCWLGSCFPTSQIEMWGTRVRAWLIRELEFVLSHPFPQEARKRMGHGQGCLVHRHCEGLGDCGSDGRAGDAVTVKV